MIAAVADTHTVIWYLFDDPRLSRKAMAAFEDAALAGEQIAISTITIAEVVYLVEKDRLQPAVFQHLWEAVDGGGLLVEAPFDRNVARVMQEVERAAVPDLPDRIIAATAVHLGVPVISRDRKIQSSSIATVW